MIRVGRPILYAHCLLLSASIVAGESALSQTFVRPQIPEGQTIGDIGASNSGAGNSVSGSFVPNSSAADSVSGINVRDVPGFDPGTDGSVEDSETMIFGPVDGDFPAGAISARDSSVPSLPPEFNQPARADRSVVTDDFSGGSGSFGRSDVTGVSPVPTMRETSARGRRADIDEMPGREIIRQRYQDGKVQIARHVKQDENGNYINDGQWQLFDRTGIKIAMGTYVDGAMEGNWARMHLKSDGGIFLNPPFSLFQGPFTSRATFSNGSLAGQWRITDAKGQKVFEMPYKDGQRHGLALWFYPGQQIFRRMQFANNVPDGPLVQFDQRGKITRKEVFQDGQRIENRVTYYRPGNRKQEAKIILRGRLELNGTDQWWDAKPAELIVTGEDIEQGPIRSWYPNGQTKMMGNLEAGSRVGRFVWWHNNGVKQSMGGYDKRGLKTGQWIWWHSNGMKSIVGQYRNDQPDGLWKEWDEHGRQLRQKPFDADAPAEKPGTGLDEESERSISLFGDRDVDVDSSIDIESPGDGSIDSMMGDGEDAESAADTPGASREEGAAPRGTDALEDISPVEVDAEGEELPTPGASATPNSSAIRSNPSGQATEDEAERFFRISF